MVSYGESINHGFQYLLSNHKNVFTIGQGLWSPWYVGNSMTDLDKKFGKSRVMDTPVSEDACTAAAIGASLCGYRPIVIHPRVDFMILATNSIVNQAAKWSHMLGGKAHPAVTIRGIVNRGGQQGAQHSQSLHSWYSHIPGLKVVMPATVQDARDLLIAATLCDDPVVYIDDRWLYDLKEESLPAAKDLDLNKMGPQVLRKGSDITIVASSYSVKLALEAAQKLESQGLSCEVIDLRIVNPLKYEEIVNSVEKTKRLCVIDGSWKNCGLAGEIIAGVCERVSPSLLISKPLRITLPEAPAPTSGALEQIYYTNSEEISKQIKNLVESK